MNPLPLVVMVLVLAAVALGLYAEHSARKQPEYKFGKRPEEGWQR